MARFIQLHLLTFYPPANLNRDDTGRPKTAIIGGVERLRVSSQAIKRAARKSDVFANRLSDHLGNRTQRLGEKLQGMLVGEFGFDAEDAKPIARTLSSLFGRPETDTKKELFIKQLAFVSPDEENRLRAVMERCRQDKKYRSQLAEAAKEVALDEGDDESDEKQSKKPKQSKATQKLLKDLKEEVLAKRDGAADIAMFGRMLADNPDFNREAAVQVAHAYTTHRVTVEDDYYTAVDDLKTKAEDAGAGFIGELGFGSGLFYHYVCIDTDLLVKNLDGNNGIAKSALAALIEALATVSPSGKQATFASRARAEYLLIEKGSQQPRTLGSAFAKPVSDADLVDASVARLEAFQQNMDKAYGLCADHRYSMKVGGEGTLAEAIAFATSW
jgi:CRISPR system Cascade subunit CasC